MKNNSFLRILIIISISFLIVPFNISKAYYDAGNGGGGGGGGGTLCSSWGGPCGPLEEINCCSGQDIHCKLVVGKFGICVKPDNSISLGGSCMWDSECISSDCIGGVCANPSPTCSNRGEPCGSGCCSGLTCISSICGEYQGRGGNCSPSWVFCSAGFDCVDGICIDSSGLLPGGSICFHNQECMSNSCIGLRCAFDVKFTNPIKPETPGAIVGNIIDVFFRGALIATPLMIILAALIFVTAAGDNKKIELARRIIIFTLVGFAIALLSKGIVSLIDELFSF